MYIPDDSTFVQHQSVHAYVTENYRAQNLLSGHLKRFLN